MVDQAILLYDGSCGLCNKTVNFILRFDRKKKFQFIPLQSPKAEDLLKKHHFSPVEISTSILIEGEKIYIKSDGFLRVMHVLGFPWICLEVLLIVPRKLRDRLYDFIARHRFAF